jgi:hypothetical protein
MDHLLENPPASPAQAQSKGGGALDPVSVMGLLVLLGLRLMGRDQSKRRNFAETVVGAAWRAVHDHGKVFTIA